MDLNELEQIRKEIAEELTGLGFGKVFPLGPDAIAIDFFPHSGRYLYISYGRGKGAAFLIRRRLKELERSATHAAPFVIDLRKRFFGMRLKRVCTMSSTDVMRLDFEGDEQSFSLVIQVGRRPNLFVVDRDEIVVGSARSSNEAGQRIGDKYAGPETGSPAGAPLPTRGGESLSDTLDAEYRAREQDGNFDSLAAEAKKKLNGEIRKKLKLLENLEHDLAKHGEPDQWKRYGDLLLANIGNIRGTDDKMIVTDYFDSELPDVEIPVEKNASPTEMAEIYFTRYAKARNGAAAIAKRQETVKSEIESLQKRMSKLDSAIAARDETAMAEFLVKNPPVQANPAKKNAVAEIRGARRFVSSDGFEILVGKKAVDNDNLTFRIAKSLDLWFHAEDYPGSHVIVRNPSRKEIPNRTLIEAAQLAAFYSDARELPKVAIRYTPKKYVNKPRRSAPGLVSLASFKTVLVEPGVGDLSPTG